MVTGLMRFRHRSGLACPGVAEADGRRACGLGRHQGQVYRRDAVPEQALARPEDQREHQEPVLIDRRSVSAALYKSQWSASSRAARPSRGRVGWARNL